LVTFSLLPQPLMPNPKSLFSLIFILVCEPVFSSVRGVVYCFCSPHREASVPVQPQDRFLVYPPRCSTNSSFHVRSSQTNPHALAGTCRVNDCSCIRHKQMRFFASNSFTQLLRSAVSGLPFLLPSNLSLRRHETTACSVYSPRCDRHLLRVSCRCSQALIPLPVHQRARRRTWRWRSALHDHLVVGGFYAGIWGYRRVSRKATF
jgi:hypothetical protein